jgi:protein SCO1/2
LRENREQGADIVSKKLLALVATLAAIGACKEKAAPRAEPVPAVSAVPIAAEPTAPSIYDLEMTLTDQDGRALALDAFAGKPVIISMFYATCPYACPMLISDINRVVSSLEPSERSEVRVLLVSLDPERDTPVALKRLAQAHRADSPNWRFTSAPEHQARELAAVLGIKYRKLENGAINHSSVITVLDGRGSVRHRSENLGQHDPELVRQLKGLVGKRLDG